MSETESTVVDTEDVAEPTEATEATDTEAAESAERNRRKVREGTTALLDSLTEDDLDKKSAVVPEGYENTFGTYRLCLQFAADHWYMHRGQLADASNRAQVELD